jgi:hypothetical protein
VIVAGEQIPEAWVGELIKLRYCNGDGRGSVGCKLEAVNDRGIVARINDDDVLVTRFYPWNAVLHIQLGGDERAPIQGEGFSF